MTAPAKLEMASNALTTALAMAFAPFFFYNPNGWHAICNDNNI